jgi:hypothetical protein
MGMAGLLNGLDEFDFLGDYEGEEDENMSEFDEEDPEEDEDEGEDGEGEEEDDESEEGEESEVNGGGDAEDEAEWSGISLADGKLDIPQEQASDDEAPQLVPGILSS